ncbi:phage major capsid protein [Nonomuraea jabiensis]|uniref:phage major capsid protein n=1 Tax=Nonomuraea jabiensis TaxID=882448 RepID=UPI003D72B3D4
MSRYVRATSKRSFYSHDHGLELHTEPGTVLRADHWAVTMIRGQEPGLFEPISDHEAADALVDGMGSAADARASELANLEARFGYDRSTWPAGQRQRAERLENGLTREAEERAQAADRERRRDVVARFAARGNTESGDGNVDVNGVQYMRRVDPFEGGDPRSFATPRGEVRDRALKALDTRSLTRHLASDQLDQVERLLRTQNRDTSGDWLGRMLLLSENEHYRSAFQEMLCSQPPALTNEQARAVQAVKEFRAMSIGSDSAGGFGLPVLIDPTIILTAQGSLNPFRRISRQVTITTDEWKGVSSQGVTWSYDGEGATVSDDSPTLAQPTVPVHMARGWIPYSIEVGMDYPSFADEMSRLLMEGYDELQAQSFAVGSGVGQPRGIITALDANTNVEVVVTADGAFGGVDVNKVWSALPDRWKANATWVMSHDVGNEIATFGNGNNMSFMTVDLTGIVQTLRTRPIEFSSYFPDFTGTTGASNILVVGDFRNFLIVDRAGMSVEIVPHLIDVTNNRPTGQRGLFAWARHGSGSTADVAFRLLQNQ